MKLVHLPFISQIQQQLDGNHIQVLLGPRQVGKTTSLLEHLQKTYSPNEYHYENCDSVSTDFAQIIEAWNYTLDGRLVVFDEIQKITQWSEHLKKLWDQNKRKKIKTRCIVLGSSSLTLQKGLSESLTGRFELTRAWHWTWPQSAKGYGLDLEKYMIYGGYPGSYELIKNQARWKNYLSESIVETVIGKDILSQAQVKSPALFRQAFHLAMSYPAQEISYNKILGQLQDKGNIDLVKYYLELFEGAFLLKKIFKYSNKNVISKTSSPKLISLAPALSTYHRLEKIDDEFKGHLFESIVGADLVRLGLDLFYWREGRSEVDYVFEFEGQLFAMEVKSGRKKSSKGLLEFTRRYPTAIPIVLSLESYEAFTNNPLKYLRKHL